jgi:hypothetical protein
LLCHDIRHILWGTIRVKHETTSWVNSLLTIKKTYGYLLAIKKIQLSY